MIWGTKEVSTAKESKEISSTYTTQESNKISKNTNKESNKKFKDRFTFNIIWELI